MLKRMIVFLTLIYKIEEQNIIVYCWWWTIYHITYNTGKETLR